MMKKLLITMVLMPMMALAVKAGSIADGLDWTGLSWTTGGTPSVLGENVDWFYSTDDSCSDGDCVMSGAGGAGYAPSWLKTTIQGPCKISFQYKFQTYGGSFVLTDNSNFLINKSGVYTERNEPWTFAEFELDGGSHELKFQYTHPGQGFVGAFNGVHLDEFRVEYDSLRTTIWYVNGTSGSDSYSGTTSSSAKKTIQAAIDAATDGDTIFVAAGTYAPIRSWGKRIVIKSVSGPRKTIIDGEGTQRCAKLLESDGWDWDVAVEDIPCNSTLDGFTLTNGYAENNVGVEGGVVKNCIITGNHGWDDSAGGGFARFYNCLIYGNRTDNHGGRPSGSGIRMSCAYNCTIVNNMSCGGGGAVSHRSKLYNCIVAENYDGNGRLDNIYEASDDKTVLTSCCVDMPMFVDVEKGDYRLAVDSPCIDAGDNAYVTSATDLAGNVRIVDGRVDIGCYEHQHTTTWYVDGTSGSDSYSGTSPTQAKKTIQAAIDVASSGDVVRVSSGVYAPIATSNKSLTIVAINGSDETYIDGMGRERCVNTHIGLGLESECFNTRVVGFTIQNGHTEGYGDDANGCGALGGTYVRCVFSNNRSDSYMAGGGACDARLENCLLVGNSTGGNGGACSGSELINCTVVDNYASDNGGGAYMCKACNCIFFGNTSGWDWGNDDGQLYWTQTENVYLNDPRFADAAHGNYQLTANSPCIDAGDNSYVTSATDLDGNARIVNGKVDIGCYEYGSESSPNNGLVAWYKFDGNVSDSSGNGNDLFFAYGGFNGEEGVSGLAIRLTADTTLGVQGVCAVSNTFSY